MKKSNFTALLLGTISSMFLGIGMCMVLLPQWNAFRPGCVLGLIGLVFALSTVNIWRRMENKTPIKLNGKVIVRILFGLVSSLILGIGMCLALVWNSMVIGIIIGLIGILMLLCLIPLCIGLK